MRSFRTSCPPPEAHRTKEEEEEEEEEEKEEYQFFHLSPFFHSRFVSFVDLELHGWEPVGAPTCRDMRVDGAVTLAAAAAAEADVLVAFADRDGRAHAFASPAAPAALLAVDALAVDAICGCHSRLAAAKEGRKINKWARLELDANCVAQGAHVTRERADPAPPDKPEWPMPLGWRKEPVLRPRTRENDGGKDRESGKTKSGKEKSIPKFHSRNIFPSGP